jgi:hypothetical protein
MNIQASLWQMKAKLGSHQKIRNNHENMDVKIGTNKAKIGTEIKTIQEKTKE